MEATEEANATNSHPIEEGLVAFRHQFESFQAHLDFVGSSRAVGDILSAESASDLVLDLILALQSLPASRKLYSQINPKTRLRTDLVSLASKSCSSDFDIKSTIPLVELVVNNAPDAEIWRAVFDLIALTRPKQLTPPNHFEKAVFDTPLRPSSACQSGTEQTHDEVDQRILEELTGRVYYDVGGFYERYFEGKPWTNNARDIYEVSRAQYTEGRWSDWPQPSLQGPFFEWVMNFQDAIFNGLRRRYYTSANKVLRGSEADRKLDIFLTPADAVFQDGEHDWSNVLVIGEHKRNPDEDGYTKTLVQLAGYAREVFGSQSDRRFVPGFTICGTLMRLWMFDRSGPYSSEKFDIHREPERFVKVIAGYALMSDAELGLNTFIKHDGNGRYIVAQHERIFLEDKPIASTKAIVCRGTTCYRGRGSNSTEWGYVVKFAWPSDKRQREGTLLKLAKDRRVTGIAEWFSHEKISIDGDPDTVAHLRRDMQFGTPRKLSSKASWVNSSLKSSRAYSKTSLKGSAAHLIGLGIGASSTTTSSSGQKRKRGERLEGGSRLKRSKSDSSHANAANVHIKGQPDATDAHSTQEAEADSLVDCESGMYGNRVNYCLVTSPAGRPLHEYRSVKELLEALRDAIRGHKSLLEDGKILHRDVSENNIIIVEATKEGQKGRLIDLDLAKELDSMPSGARHRTGTMQFMAIEILEGKKHTYRHDLESFLYVFMWMCIRYGHEGAGEFQARPRSTRTNVLRDWYTGNYRRIARMKRGDMDKNAFEYIVSEFAPQFESLKQLARELRNVLFPIRDGAIFTGTFRDNDIMYDGMINAFSRAIDRLEKGEQAIA